jgi:hypothetical protein
MLQCIICKSKQAIGDVLTHYLSKDVLFIKNAYQIPQL